MLDFNHTKTVKETVQTQTVKKTDIKFKHKKYVLVAIGVFAGSALSMNQPANLPETAHEPPKGPDIAAPASIVNWDVVEDMADRYLTRRFSYPIAIDAKRHLIINRTREPKLPDADSVKWLPGGIGHAVGYKDTAEGRFYMLVFSFDRLDRRDPSWAYLDS